MIAFSIKLDKKLSKIVEKLRTGLPEVIDAAVKDTSSYGKGLIIRSTAKDTGRTQGGWVVNKLKAMAYMIWNRFEHAKYLETGTGIYGPRHQRIYPRTAKFLSWIPFHRNTPGGRVFVKSTKGMPAQPAIAPNVDKIQKDLNIRVMKNIRKLFQRAKSAGVVASLLLAFCSCATTTDVDALRDDVKDLKYDVQTLDKKLDSVEGLKSYPWTFK